MADTDPALHAAQSLAVCMAAFRDLLADPAYAAVLPAFESLSRALPNPLEVPVPAPRAVEELHPLDRGPA